MTARQLPSRPDLEQLKRQAKELQQSAGVPLHEAQTRLAREYGFASWNKLREEVEARTLEFAAAVTEFLEAATDGRRDRAQRVLALQPTIATANFYTALVPGDVNAVDARLTKDPSLATTAGGPRGWLPIHYICYTSVGSSGLPDIARRLIGLGVDPNPKFPWLHHNVPRPIRWRRHFASAPRRTNAVCGRRAERQPRGGRLAARARRLARALGGRSACCGFQPGRPRGRGRATREQPGIEARDHRRPLHRVSSGRRARRRARARGDAGRWFRSEPPRYGDRQDGAAYGRDGGMARRRADAARARRVRAGARPRIQRPAADLGSGRIPNGRQEGARLPRSGQVAAGCRIAGGVEGRG